MSKLVQPQGSNRFQQYPNVEEESIQLNFSLEREIYGKRRESQQPTKAIRQGT